MAANPHPEPGQRIPVCKTGWHANKKEGFYFLNNQSVECVISGWPGSHYPFTEEPIKVPPRHGGKDGVAPAALDDLPDGTYKYQVTGCDEGHPLTSTQQMASTQQISQMRTFGLPKDVTIP